MVQKSIIHIACRWFLYMVVFLAAPCATVLAQVEIGSFRINNSKKRLVIPFKIVHNLVIIPLSINGSDTLNFILDTGVTTALLTTPPEGEDLSLNYLREVQLSGLGEGDPIKAFYSTGNTFDIYGIKGVNHDLLVLQEDVFHLSASMGVFVHGLIGYDIFSNFVVEINYDKNLLVLYEEEAFSENKKYRRRLGKPLKILIEKNKPYVFVQIGQADGSSVNAKLLIDSGASHAVSLYLTSDSTIIKPNHTISTFLGAGLNGDIFGDIGRLPKMKLDRFVFDNLIATYPHEDGIQQALNVSNRNGSIGSEILKRFNVAFHYKEGLLYLKPNHNYKKRFTYNLSGIDVYTPLPGLPVYEIAKVRKNSPAMQAGLSKGDQLIMINGVSATRYTLNDIIELFHSKPGRKMKLFVQRYNKIFKAEFNLDQTL